MKRLLALLLVALMMFSMVACGEEEKSAGNNDTEQNNSSNTAEPIVVVEGLLGRYESEEYSGKFFIFNEEGIEYCWSSDADPVSMMAGEWEVDGNHLIVPDMSGYGGGVFEIICDNNTVVQLKFIEYLNESAGALGGKIEFFSTLTKCDVSE